MVTVLPVILYKYSAALLLRLSRARPAEQADYPAISGALLRSLCIGAGLPVPRLNVIDSQGANPRSPQVGGPGSRRWRSPRDCSSCWIVAADGRTRARACPDRQLRHAAGDCAGGGCRVLASAFHHSCRHLPILLPAPLGGGLVHVSVPGASCHNRDPIEPCSQHYPSSAKTRPASWALLVAASVPLYSLLIAPLLAELIRIAVIRHRVHLADADAVLLARGSEPADGQLTKMEAASSRGLNAARASAHLWTVDPFRDAGWLDRVWPSCHPPMSELVALALRRHGGRWFRHLS